MSSPDESKRSFSLSSSVGMISLNLRERLADAGSDCKNCFTMIEISFNSQLDGAEWNLTIWLMGSLDSGSQNLL